MRQERSHADLEDLLGVYALDALDTREREMVEEHLPSCPSCRDEVAQHREVASVLASPAGPAPAELWDRIAAVLDEAPPPLGLAPVASLADRRRRSVRVLAAMTAVAAAVIGVLGVRLVAQENRLDRLQAATAGDALERAALVAMANPAASKVDLRSPDRSAAAQVALLPDGRGYILADGLPGLAPDRTYQLWALVDGERISAGTLGHAAKVAAFHVSGAVAGFAITEEHAGGVVASKNAPVLIGFVPST